MDCHWLVVVCNLIKARRQWARLSRILGGEGADARTLGRFYMETVQTTLLFGSEMFVVNPRMVQTLRVFHHHVARRLMGNLPQHFMDGFYHAPLLGDDLREAGLEEIMVYILRIHNTSAQYITARPIMEL